MIQGLLKPMKYFNPDYLKTLVIRKRGLGEGETIPLIESRSDEMILGGERLSDYQKLCAYEKSSNVPATYPFVLAFRLHMKNMMNSKFPVPLLGIVHTRNRIEQKRPITDSEPITIKCSIEGQERTHQGIEFDLIAEAYSGSELIWKSISTMLSRRAPGTPRSKSAPKKKIEPLVFNPESTNTQNWTLNKELGLRYAQNSGDFNPIHIYQFVAKSQGFRTIIIHGMWSLARALTKFDNIVHHGPVTITSNFVLPCFLPSKPVFKYDSNEEITKFGLYSMPEDKPHLSGTIIKGIAS